MGKGRIFSSSFVSEKLSWHPVTVFFLFAVTTRIVGQNEVTRGNQVAVKSKRPPETEIFEKKKATSFRVRRNSVTPTPGRLFYSRITFTERAKGKLKGRRGVQQNCRKGVRYELQALFVVQKACAKDGRTCYATTQGTLLPPGQRPGTIIRRVPEALKISRRRPSNPQLRGVQVHGQFL